MTPIQPLRTALLSLGLLFTFTAPLLAQPDFIAFESGPVRPLALSPDGNTLFVTNIPDNRLEIFDVSSDQPRLLGDVSVGLEPVAVAVLDAETVFVANHLSDSVSVVKLSPRPHVAFTLLVGDEPRDMVIADPDLDGPLAPRLFVTTARRGQHRNHPSLNGVPGAGDPLLSEPSVPRADVWVFDIEDFGDALGGIPLAIVELFSDTPRPLAVSRDQRMVYAAAHFSGNQTTIIDEDVVCNGFTLATACTIDGISSPGGLPGGLAPGGNPGPSENIEGVRAPEVGLIVQWSAEAQQFQDELGRNWNNGVRFRLPDHDVFAIDTFSLQEQVSHTGVGTTLFNMAINPRNGALYISNTEARNLKRFEGPVSFSGSTVQGHLAETRITIIPDPHREGSAVRPRHLNKHIDYAQLPSDAQTRAASLSTPLEMAFSPNGNTVYLAAYGSGAIAYFDSTALENDSFSPSTSNHIALGGGGPAGVVLNASGSRLYAYTRFDNGISVVDTAQKQEIVHLSMFSPEPASVVQGRPILYDAQLSSSNGEASCASCHIFGDTDHLAWDLGNPSDRVKFNPIMTLLGFAATAQTNGGAAVNEFHPMKGPMTTQTLRGLAHSGAMHWRGDRANGALGMHATDADLSFRNFIEAFTGLLGREHEISEDDMQAFADFQLQVMLPPNPNRRLDNSLRPNEQAGADFFSGPRLSDGVPINIDHPNPLLRFGFTCEGCHELKPEKGFYGTGTSQSFEGSSQIFKIPHLRNLYTKVGMFGMPQRRGLNGLDNSFMGDQVRGYGFTHSGSMDTLFRFMNLSLFQAATPASPVGFTHSSQHHEMESFMMVFDTDLAPIVGQQITYTVHSSAAVTDRLELLMQRANSDFVALSLGGNVVEANLVAKATVDGIPRGWLYQGGDRFLSDLNESYSLDELKCLADMGEPVTFTAVPPGSGQRIGLDRDSDGLPDGVGPDREGMSRSAVAPSGSNTARTQHCLQLREARVAQSTWFNCDSGLLDFAVAVEGDGNYQVRMQLVNESPVRFELTEAERITQSVENIAEYSQRGELWLPLAQLSCANVVGNLRFRLLQDAPIRFELESTGY